MTETQGASPAARGEAPARGGGDRPEGDRRGGRGGFGGRGRRDGPGGRPGGFGGRKGEEWFPKTKLGRLVKNNHIDSLEQIYSHAIPIKEAEIVEHLMEKNKADGTPHTLSDEVMKIISVQKQTKAGQRTRFKAIVAIGDHDGHVGLGIKVAKEVQIAIKGALITAKLSLIPVRRGYWGNKIGGVHTVPGKVTGKCGSVRCKLVPAPRGTGIVGAPISKKLLQFAGIDDVYTSTTGHTRTPENFIKAVFQALCQTYRYLTPDLWPAIESVSSPYAMFAEELQKYALMKPMSKGGDRGGRGGRGGRGRGGRGGRGGDRGGRGGDRGGRGRA